MMMTKANWKVDGQLRKVQNHDVDNGDDGDDDDDDDGGADGDDNGDVCNYQLYRRWTRNVCSVQRPR